MCKKMICAVVVLCLVGAANAQPNISEDFSSDPGWLEINNRTNPGTVGNQLDYGYNAAGQNAGGYIERTGTGNRSFYGIDLGATYGLGDELKATFSMDMQPTPIGTQGIQYGGAGNEGLIGFFDRNYPIKTYDLAATNTRFVGMYYSGNTILFGYLYGNRTWNKVSGGWTNDSGTHNVTVRVSPSTGLTVLAVGSGHNYNANIMPGAESGLTWTLNTFGMIALNDSAQHTEGYLYMDDVSVTPEPATIALLGLGGLALIRRKRAH
jgi:hypothetical protein